MSESKKCPECNEPFNWDDKIIYVETLDDHYHEKCVELYPVKYFAFAHGEPLGDVDNDADCAYEYLSDGEYIDAEEADSDEL